MEWKTTAIPSPTGRFALAATTMLCAYQLLQTHSWRMLEWMLVQIPPSTYETLKLEAVGIPCSSPLASYCVWRRTMLLAAFPSLTFWGISSLHYLWGDMERYALITWFGKILIFLPIFAGLALVVGTAGALWHWTDPVLSNRWIMVGWILSLGLPFIPGFVPVDFILSKELLADPATHQWYNNFYAMVYMEALVPVYVSIPLGMVRASLRIRGLLPDNGLAGWILMVTLPFKMLLLTLGLAFASQMVGDVKVIVAMTLYMVGPIVYFWNRKLYTDPIAEDWREKVQRRQAIVRWSGLAALLLLSVWLFTADVYGKSIVGVADGDDDASNDPFYTYSDVAQKLFEVMGCTFISTLCFADLFLRAAIAHWSSSRNQRHRSVGEPQRSAVYRGMQTELEPSQVSHQLCNCWGHSKQQPSLARKADRAKHDAEDFDLTESFH